MKIKIVALYPVALEGYDSLPDLKRRQLRDGSVISVVDCDVESIAEKSVARPRHVVPEGHPPPTFRAQLTMLRGQLRKTGVAVLAQPASHARLDFESRILAPSYTDHTRVVFEFHHAEVLYVGPDDSVEVRLVVVDKRSGEVGTKSIASFHASYFGILDKCRRQLAGLHELFPVRHGYGYRPASLPEGKADLAFGETGPVKSVTRKARTTDESGPPSLELCAAVQIPEEPDPTGDADTAIPEIQTPPEE